MMPFISCQSKSVDLDMMPGAFSNYKNMTSLLYIYMSDFYRKWEPESAPLGSLTPLFGDKSFTSAANMAAESMCGRNALQIMFDESAGVNRASKWLGPYRRD